MAAPPSTAATQYQSRVQAWRHPVLAWSAAYVLLTSLTGAFFMADTVDYVVSAVRHEQGVNWMFWDFRHLFWRPLGWFIFHCSTYFIHYSDFAGMRAAVTRIFISLNWCAGLASVLLLRQLLRRFCRNEWAVNFSLLAFLFAQGFLNYIHSGSSYTFGLFLLIAGMYFLGATTTGPSPRRIVAGALALALSVCFWFPYFFAMLGALSTPLFVSRRNWRVAAKAALLCLCFGTLFYGAVILHLRLGTTAALKTWITTGAADVAGVRGPTRTIFGLARSFINMGQDGVLYKRFLLRDPYNHVSAAELLRLSIVKLAIFYLLLLAVCLTLWRSSESRPILWLFLLGAVPVITFGLYWYGGDVERYLPLYPFFFIALAAALQPAHAKWTRTMAVVFLAVAIISNISVTSALKLKHQEQTSEARVQPLLPLYRPHSRVVLVDIHDDLENFERSFPFAPLVSRSGLSFYPLLNPGTPQTLEWRQDFAQIATAVWQRGGDVWLSRRLFEQRPRRDSAWVEGADVHVKWSEVPACFSQLDLGKSAGGEDGFVLLQPDQKDRALLGAWSAPAAPGRLPTDLGRLSTFPRSAITSLAACFP